MKLFHTDQYFSHDIDPCCQLKNPLGTLERQYSVNAGSEPMRQERRYYKHCSRESEIFTWTGPDCTLEELLVTFTPQGRVLPPDIKCQAVVIRIKSFAGQTLDARLVWLPGYQWTEGIGRPGEALESRSWFDANWDVIIGTEDSEFLTHRSRAGKWMPKRLASDFEANSDELVEITDDSICIHLPKLECDEICQIHFVVASGPRRDDDNSLWLAVDQDPEVLLAAGDCD